MLGANPTKVKPENLAGVTARDGLPLSPEERASGGLVASSHALLKDRRERAAQIRDIRVTRDLHRARLAVAGPIPVLESSSDTRADSAFREACRMAVAVARPLSGRRCVRRIDQFCGMP